jgi:hypothetical protein
MIEATDDSILFARSLQALQSFCLLEERFQYAYGWLTNWQKTTAYVLSPKGPQPDTVSLPSNGDVSVSHALKILKIHDDSSPSVVMITGDPRAFFWSPAPVPANTRTRATGTGTNDASRVVWARSSLLVSAQCEPSSSCAFQR